MPIRASSILAASCPFPFLPRHWQPSDYAPAQPTFPGQPETILPPHPRQFVHKQIFCPPRRDSLPSREFCSSTLHFVSDAAFTDPRNPLTNIDLPNRPGTGPIVNSCVFISLPPLVLLFAPLLPLVSFLFSHLQTLFCKAGGWGVITVNFLNGYPHEEGQYPLAQSRKTRRARR